MNQFSPHAADEGYGQNIVTAPSNVTAHVPQTVLHAGNAGYKGPPPWPDLPKTPQALDAAPAAPPHPYDTPLGVRKAGVPLARGFGGEDLGAGVREALGMSPKNVMGRKRLPIFSVVPMAALLEIAKALQYGAFEAPKADGSKGYGPMNWRDEKIELLGYVDANGRHVARWVDGQDLDSKSGAHELAHAAASLIIALDAILNKSAVDDRRTNGGISSKILDNYESQRKE